MITTVRELMEMLEKQPKDAKVVINYPFRSDDDYETDMTWNGLVKCVEYDEKYNYLVFSAE